MLPLVHVLCVTGDIVDQAIAERMGLTSNKFLMLFLNKFKRINKLSYHDFLQKLWGDAKSFFEYICQQADVDSSAIFVIPGNHDYRLQGFLGNDQEAMSLFKTCFGDFFMNRKLRFENQNHETINVDFICLDSNLDAKEEDLATGSIPKIEMMKLFESDQHLEGINQVNSITSFRVCLLHHHPLPVVPAENYEELGNQTTFSAERLKRFQEILTGPQTTLLKNAGAFLHAAIVAKVDLVLHGHDHQPWVSEISYPGVDGYHRLIVAAAGKSVKGNDSSYTFNSAQLFRDSNIQIIHRTIKKNLADVDNASPFPNYSDSQLREIRWKKTCEKLRGRPVEGSEIDQGVFYGAMRADRVARLIEISEAGNANVTFRFEGLEPITDKPIRILPLHINSSGPYFYPTGGEHSRKTILGTSYRHHYNITAQFEPSKESGGNDTWVIMFNPELQQGHPLSFEISYTVYNAFEFIQEQRRARAKKDKRESILDGFESVKRGARIVFPEKMSEMIIFPPGYNLTDNPQVFVDDSEENADDLEEKYCTKWLQSIKSRRIIALTIDRPLPGRTYGIAWPLITKDKHDEKKYKPESIWNVKTIATKPVSDLDERIKDMLVALRSRYSEDLKDAPCLMDHETELSLFIVQHDWQERVDAGPILNVTLNLCAYAPSSSKSLLRFPLSFHEGEGIVGQAFRSAKVVRDDSSGQSGLYKMLKEQIGPYEFLWATPLFARTSQDFEIDRKNKQLHQEGRKGKMTGTEQGEYAPFGVLCIATYKKNSGLKQLLGMTDSDCVTREGFIDHMEGQFAPNIYKHLITPARI